jgi:hypothetical protein
MLRQFNPHNVREKKPNRELTIQKDEVVSLKIDLEVLTIDQLYEKYFSYELKRGQAS